MNENTMTNSLMYLFFVFEIQKERHALGLISEEEYVKYVEKLHTDLTVDEEEVTDDN